MNVASVATMTQRQWFKRPADEKFASIEDVLESVRSRRNRSHKLDFKMSDLGFEETDKNDILMTTKDGHKFTPTHWSFGQIANTLAARPEFLRELPANLVVQILSHKLDKHIVEKRNRELGLMLIDPKGDNTAQLQAVTGSTYGRIWDEEIVRATMDVLDKTGGRFFSPVDWGGEKRALFSSDRDIHMMFIDGGSIMEAGMTWDHKPDVLHRGWIIGNSEVGARSMYLATFLFRMVCGNFCIHGITEVNLKSIRHTPGAPGQFVKEAIPALKAYVEESAKPVEAAIKRAQALELPKAVDDFQEWFKAKGFTQHETIMARMTADKEEGGHHTLWMMVNGFTKYAQRITHRDTRIVLEQKAGKLLERLAK